MGFKADARAALPRPRTWVFLIGFLKRHGRWRSETANDEYVKDSLTVRLLISKNLGI